MRPLPTREKRNLKGVKSNKGSPQLAILYTNEGRKRRRSVLRLTRVDYVFCIE